MYAYLILLASLQPLPLLLLLQKFWRTMDWLLRRVILPVCYISIFWPNYLQLSVINNWRCWLLPFVKLHLCRDHDINCWYEGWFKGASNSKSKGNGRWSVNISHSVMQLSSLFMCYIKLSYSLHQSSISAKFLLTTQRRLVLWLLFHVYHTCVTVLHLVCVFMTLRNQDY